MKNIKRRSFMALLLSAAILGTSVAPVFAEGSNELNTVPSGSDTSTYQANRAYLDWRDRDQFNMPSKNVIYAYAKAGEIIYFGSNVTDASDRSIEAVVHKESMTAAGFTDTTLNLDGSNLQGRSIAVTLPSQDNNKVAFNPEIKAEDFAANFSADIFADGDTLSASSYDRTKVYLFDVEKNGDGHIGSRTMEKNGPNGVNNTTDGYDPLSFVAPVTGTYSFRFLSSQYGTGDDLIASTMAPSDRVKYATIDFNGVNGELNPITSSELYNKTVSYYEPGVGYVSLLNANRPISVEQLTEDVSGDIVAGDKYIKQAGEKGSEPGKGAVYFTPLHSGIELEIVWQPILSEGTTAQARVRSKQGSNDASTYIDCTSESGVQRTVISDIRGNLIQAGEDIYICIGNIPHIIYEINYYYDRTTAQEVPLGASPTPIPTAEPTAVPTATPTLSPEEMPEDEEWTTLNEELVAAVAAANVDTDGDENADDGTAFSYGNLNGYGLWTEDAKSATYTHTNGKEYSFTKAWRAGMGSITGSKPTRNFYFTPEGECTVTVVYAAQIGRPVHINQGGVDLISGEEEITDGVAPSISYKITDPSKGDVYIYGGSSGKNIYAIFVDYTINDTAESATTQEMLSLFSEEDVAVTTDIKPVAEDYTWNFYYMKEKRDENNNRITQYTDNRLVGTFAGFDDGVDYDSSYDYDLKIYATAEHPVNINQESLWLYEDGVFDETTGLPSYSVLEMVPGWNGTVEAVYGTGSAITATVAIKQGTAEPVTSSASNGNTGATRLNVTAGTPVYIYSTGGMPYLKAIKFTADIGELTDLARSIDDPWANNTPSQVAAWDVTVAGVDTQPGDTISWNLGELFSDVGAWSTTTQNGLTFYYGSGSTIGVYSNVVTSAIKVNGLRSDNTNRFEYIPETRGTLKLYAYSDDVTRSATIKQGDTTFISEGFESTRTVKEFSAENVAAGVPVDIYSSSGIYFYKIEFTPDVPVSDEIKIKDGRVWADVLYLNAGAFKSSIYPEFDILTEDGFLYDVRLNGIQPYSFVFYSNNRGFLFDPWSMYSEPERSGITETKERLQALEHSFYSYSTGSDVGDAPVRIEKDENGNPIVYNNNIMQSAVLGNYVPVDAAKDATHKIFFNTPDSDSMSAYTGSDSLRTVDKSDVSTDILNGIEYTGLGNAADNSGSVHYGTIGIGGRFKLTLDTEQANKLSELGVNSVSILLDFSTYALDENSAPVLNDDNTWKLRAEMDDTTQTEAEKNNTVSLSSVVNGAGNYILSWDGRDSHGNVVPKGEYSQAVKSFVEMGMAHFPFLDAEQNPNGIKVRMVNEIPVAEGETDKRDYIYYNNEAVSPLTNEGHQTAWYFTGRSNVKDYPYQIGNGKNMIAGESTNYASPASEGGMAFNDYEYEETGYIRDDGGYGNYAAIDLWSKYEIQADAKLTIGVNPIVELKPYVSFVATNGTVPGGELPFKVSHVGYGGQKLEEYSSHYGISSIYGNTISTGFVTKLSTTADNATNEYVTWDISVPVTGIYEDSDESGNTTTTEMPSFIKIPTADKEEGKLTTQKLIDEQEYLAYEMYSGLFEDYAIDSDEVNIGEESDPDWEADASLNSDEEPGIMDAPDGAEAADNAFTEEMYIEAMSLSAVEGDYSSGDNWSITINVDPAVRLADSASVTNKGDIHQVNAIGGSEDGIANIKLRYKLPTTITGTGTISLGIVIDNLYAPGAVAKAAYTSSDLEAYHDITSTLFNTESHSGSVTDSVQASGVNNYATNPNNEYYSAVKPTIDASKNVTVEFENYVKGWSYVIDYRTDIVHVADGETALGFTANNDIFYLGEYDMTDLAEIEVFAGTNEIGTGFELFAVDVTGLDVSSMKKEDISAKLTSEASLGTTGVTKSGWSDYKSHTIIATGKTGTMGLFMKCKTTPEVAVTGWSANYDYMTLKYSK